ncbi:hypothetical protein Goari_003793 [Gossypium aridum]|uniref:Cytochrome P450 n=1 Tax=Gossypium aridum TaxID=34290 RepID=A0A7J8Y348_GOSAI|nr:hypothetical protein [Gossypium aridum]
MFAAAPYGPFWRQVRKFATVELLSNHRLDLMKHVQESEIKTSMQEKFVLSDALPFLRWLDIGGEEKLMKKTVKELDQALILAVEDTTSITLTWALSLLLYNRDAMRKVQQELNVHIGKH